MKKNNVIELAGRDTIVDPLTDLLRTGAEKLICRYRNYLSFFNIKRPCLQLHSRPVIAGAT